MVLLWLWEVGKWHVVWFCLTHVSVCQCPGRAHDLKSCHHPCLGRESNLWTWGANQVILPLSHWDGQKLDLEIKLMSCSLRIYFLVQALAMTHKSVKSLQLVEESKLIGMVLLWLWEVGKWNVVWFCLTQVSVCQCPGRAHDLKSCHHPCLGRPSETKPNHISLS